MAGEQILFMLVIMAVETEEFPVAAIRRIIVVVMILVVDGQLPQTFAFERTSATCADVRENTQSPLAVAVLAFCNVASQFRLNLGAFGSV